MFSVCLSHFMHCHCTTRERKMKERRIIVRERLCLCASVLKKGGVRRQKELDVDVVVVFVLRRQRSNKIIDFFSTRRCFAGIHIPEEYKCHYTGKNGEVIIYSSFIHSSFIAFDNFWNCSCLFLNN